MTLDEAIKIMKQEVKDEYALSYINNLPEAIEYGTEGLIVQLLYILENCKNWKGPKAIKIKKFIKNWIKLKQNDLGNIPGPF